MWLGDVGWNRFEEINRIGDLDAVRNFGWPCYEGDDRQSGYDGQDLDICEDLYADGAAAHDTPYFAYAHGSEFVGGDGCGTGGSAAAGVAFSPGGDWPDAYDGALFSADYNRDCIWVLPAGPDGLPDPAQRAPFVAPAANPVDLATGPDGDLYYININDGELRRISYFAENLPPVADVQRDGEPKPPPRGAKPSQCQMSSPPQPEALPKAAHRGPEGSACQRHHRRTDGESVAAVSMAAATVASRSSSVCARLKKNAS